MQINPHPTIEQSRFRGTAIMLMAALLVTATSANTKALGQSLTTSARPIINIQFNDGGTVGEYLGSLHEQCESQKFKLNVIVDEGTKAVKLPSFTLRDVSLDSAIMLLSKLPLKEDVSFAIDSERNIFVISSYESQSIDMNAQSAQVISVRHILEDRSKEDLLSAIEIGTKLIDESDTESMTLALHAETGLLFAKGSSEHLKMIADIVDQLTDSPEQSTTKLQEQLLEKMLNGTPAGEPGGRRTKRGR